MIMRHMTCSIATRHLTDIYAQIRPRSYTCPLPRLLRHLTLHCPPLARPTGQLPTPYRVPAVAARAHCFANTFIEFLICLYAPTDGPFAQTQEHEVDLD